ncbi:hypothetical protein [Methanococcus voltae]|uniref:Uncharacterized protein n=1 Tax=Methanococcus voltae (strain ATCC BAA-1334 / A3) TaxID=456320 RepID=D7DSJ6_METV3|nr:hypothetical protein [Methanococcus voltae]MCS3901705.1 small neutral amino acid transporter SnatA (MarC family) [Methanococcus voltae]
MENIFNNRFYALFIILLFLWLGGKIITQIWGVGLNSNDIIVVCTLAIVSILDDIKNALNNKLTI